MAIVWGPLAGYFGARETGKLTLTPVQPSPDGPGWPMAFDISMGVRKGNTVFQKQIDSALVRDRAGIDAILSEYHVPLLPLPVLPQDRAQRK